MSLPQLYFNGLDATDGAYVIAPRSIDEVARIALSEQVDPAQLAALVKKNNVQVDFGVGEDVADVGDLAQTGWGVIFAANTPPAVYEALQPLLDLRKEQASRSNPRFYCEFRDDAGYHDGETLKGFMLRHDIPPDAGQADPNVLPYYLLLVGDPEAIPYSFQYQLDVVYAVGRICFDSPAEYACYAESVVAAERGDWSLPRRAVLFGVENPDDQATLLSAETLVAPLVQKLATMRDSGDAQKRWELQTVLKTDATKARLGRMLGGDETPAVLFTASHGVSFSMDDPRQVLQQGALVCQDWPGPQEYPASKGNPLPRDFYFAAEDVPDSARLLGLITFHFACLSAGTPRLDDLPQRSPFGGVQVEAGSLGLARAQNIARRAFVARLPTRLLSHPKGGALAVVGHVERALGSSFAWTDSHNEIKSNVGDFDNTLKKLLRGYPVGAALEYFSQSYAAKSAALTSQIQEVRQKGLEGKDVELAYLWMENTNARGYVIFGDPAVRATVRAGAPGVAERPVIQSIAIASPARPGSQNAGVDSGKVDGGKEGAAAAFGSVATAERVTPARSTTPSIRLEIDAQTGRMVATTQPLNRGPATGPGANEFADFGLFGWGDSSTSSKADEIRARLTQSLQDFTGALGDALKGILKDVTELEIITYVSEDANAVTYDKGQSKFVGPLKHVAHTVIRLDGDVTLVISQDAAQNGVALMNIHTDSVARAQASRAELLKAVTSVAGELMNLFKP